MNARTTWRALVIPAAIVLAAALAPRSASATGAESARTVPASTYAGRVTAATTSCRDVELIGARGSGEKPQGRDSYATAPDKGLGSEVYTSWQTALGGLRYLYSVRETTVHYPALGVEYLYPHSGWASRVKIWMAGVAAGKKAVIAELSAIAAKCKGTRFVLIGYSQGAEVMHQVLSALVKNTTMLGRIAFVELIADPDRAPGQGIVLAGTASAKASGVDTWLRNSAKQAAFPIPAVIRSRVVSICDVSDLVCNFSAWSLTHIKSASQVHTTHYKGTTITQLWGKRDAAGVLRALPAKACAGIRDAILPTAAVCAAAATGSSAKLTALLAPSQRNDVAMRAVLQRSWRTPESQLQMVRALHAGGFGADIVDFPGFAYYTLTPADLPMLVDGAKWMGFTAPASIPDGYIAAYRGLVVSFGYAGQNAAGKDIYYFWGVHHYPAQQSPGVLCQFPMLPSCT